MLKTLYATHFNILSYLENKFFTKLRIKINNFIYNQNYVIYNSNSNCNFICIYNYNKMQIENFAAQKNILVIGNTNILCNYIFVAVRCRPT